MWRVLDAILLVTIVAAPWALLVYALSRLREILRRDWWVLALLAVGLWFFLLHLLSPLTETFVQGIIHATPKPWFAAYRESILVEGRAPLWMPHLGTGLPGLANPYVATMSPFTSLLLLFANLDQGVNVLVLAHLLFIGLSGFLLGRSLGFSRVVSLLAVLPVFWNPWVFRRLTTEVHALYIFGYAWLPLTWALAVRFLRTRAFGDALAAGIPLAFMVIGMPTVFAQAAFAVGFLLVAALAWDAFRRRWRAVRRLAVGAVLIPVAVFLTAAPEHLAARELFSVTAETRFTPKRIAGGWRDRDLSTKEFLRVLFPNELGAVVFPLPHRVDAFGIPFSPGDAIVVIAGVGAVAAVFPRFRRWRSLLVLHLLLFLVLASMVTHGIAYEPVHRVWPLWGVAGNFPVVGALLLMILSVAFGIGLEALAHAVTRLGTRLRLGPGTAGERAFRGALLTAGIALLVTDALWGLRGAARGLRGPRPADLRFNIPHMPIADLRRLPHLDALRALTKEQELPARIYCHGDRPVWPSPCFDYAVASAGVEAVGIGELAWAMPRWQWNVFRELESASDGTLSGLQETLLRLASVRYLVHTRDLSYPVRAWVPWDPAPGNFELYGKFLQSAIGNGAWTEAWDGQIRIHEFPGFPRVFFADAMVVAGAETESDAVVHDLLARGVVHPLGFAYLHQPPGEGHALPVFASTPDAAAAREAFLATHPSRGKPVANVKLRTTSLHQGAWSIEGDLPRRGALLLSQLSYPGMQATVDGSAARVVRADLFLSAIPVPAGEVRATLEYAPRGILASSLLTAPFAAFLGFLTIRRSTRSRSTL